MLIPLSEKHAFSISSSRITVHRSAALRTSGNAQKSGCRFVVRLLSAPSSRSVSQVLRQLGLDP